MKIAIPTNSRKGMEDTVQEHFGRCNTYTILDETGTLQEIIDNEGMHRGGSETPPRFLKRKGINILLCKSLGPKALQLFQNFGIEVYISDSNTVKAAFDSWKNKKSKKASSSDACEDSRH